MPKHEARVVMSGHQPILELCVYEDASLDSQFRFSLTGKGGKREGVLKKIADGHFQTALPVEAPGDYRIELTELRKNRQIPYPAVGYTLFSSLDQELPRAEFNAGLLAKLAQATGGEIDPGSFDAVKTQEVTSSY